jgi:hypothetical protein
MMMLLGKMPASELSSQQTNFGCIFSRRAMAYGAVFAVALSCSLARADNLENGMDPALAPDQASPPTQSLKNELARLGITGSVRTGYWSSNRLYDDVDGIGTASAWLKLEKKLDNGIGLFAEGYSAREDFRSDGNTRSAMREMYIETRRGDFDFRIGRQIIAWGRTDRLNPTDNLTPRDSRLLAADIDEDRFGSLAVKTAWNLDSYSSLTLVWLPEVQVNKSYSKFSENIPTANNQWAIKYDQSGKTIDWSLSYYDGYDITSDLSSAYVYNHYRIKVYGMDMATTVGSNRFALESAYTQTQDMNGTNDFIKNPFLYTVFGVEHDFGNNTSGIIQIFNRHVYNYTDPNTSTASLYHAIFSSQLDRNQDGISIRIAKKWLNETLETEIAGSTLLERNGYSLRPRVTYLWSDSIKLLAGYEYYAGNKNTYYGYLKDNNTLFMELRYFY